MDRNYNLDAKRCLVRLSEDFIRINRDLIERKDYAEALKQWRYSLKDSNFQYFEKGIEIVFFNGNTFNIAANILIDSLNNGDNRAVDLSSRLLLTCIRQLNMRERAQGM